MRHNQRRGCGWLPGQAVRGYCNRLGWYVRWYVGLHLLTVVTPQGLITGFGSAPGNSGDTRLPEAGSSASGGSSLADTGFEEIHWAPRWHQQYQATVLIPPKCGTAHSRPVHPWARALRRAFAGWRQIVESVRDKVLHALGLEHERPHTLAGFRACLAARVALHNCCCWLNHSLARPLLAFADLLDW